MRILIVEDEALIAQRIERLIREILGASLRQVVVKPTIESARTHLREHPLDVLILDLNLNGKNGFELLTAAVSGAFQTFVISAYTDRAVEAYEYGVLDFIAKPFNKQRLQKAFDRYDNQHYRAAYPIQFLAVRKNQQLQLLNISDIAYLRGAGNYAELHLTDGRTALHDKSLRHLIPLLPAHFERIHKSFIVNFKCVEAITNQYEIRLHGGTRIPISRSKYKALKDRLG